MRVRINQFECRWSQGRYEIVKWQLNKYYNMEQEYLDNGWKLQDGFYRLDNVNIDANCFVNPETCYTIATLHYDKGEGCCDMKTIGPRLLDLDKTERDDFFTVYEYAEARIRKEELARTEEIEY